MSFVVFAVAYSVLFATTALDIARKKLSGWGKLSVIFAVAFIIAIPATLFTIVKYSIRLLGTISAFVVNEFKFGYRFVKNLQA